MKTEDWIGLGVISAVAIGGYMLYNKFFSDGTTASPQQQAATAQDTVNTQAANNASANVKNPYDFVQSVLNPANVNFKKDNTTYQFNPSGLNWWQKLNLDQGNWYMDRTGNMVFTPFPNVSQAVDIVTGRDTPCTLKSPSPQGIGDYLGCLYNQSNKNNFPTTATPTATGQYNFLAQLQKTSVLNAPYQKDIATSLKGNIPSYLLAANKTSSLSPPQGLTTPTGATTPNKSNPSVLQSQKSAATPLKVGQSGSNSFGTWSVIPNKKK